MTRPRKNALGNLYLEGDKMAKEIVLTICIAGAAFFGSWFAVNFLEEHAWRKFMEKNK